MTKKRISRPLREGMVFEKKYYGKLTRLVVVRHQGVLQFKTGEKVFATLTAAARHIVGDETRQISGPAFWGAPVKEKERQ